MSRTALACVVTALVVTTLAYVTPAAASDASMLLPGDPRLVNLISAEQTLLDLTNADRVANGVDPLEVDPETLDIARQRAETQLGAQSLSHHDATGQLIFARMLGDANLDYQLAGENLARASSSDPSVVQRVEQALMQSPTHRKNILERTFTRVAIGAATDSSGQLTFAEVYRD